MECRLRHVPFLSRRFAKACRDPSLWLELRVLLDAFPMEERWRYFLRWLAVRVSGLQTLVLGAEMVRNNPCFEKNPLHLKAADTLIGKKTVAVQRPIYYRATFPML